MCLPSENTITDYRAYVHVQPINRSSYHTAIPSQSRIMLQNTRRCTWTRLTCYMYTRYKRLCEPRFRSENAFSPLREKSVLGLCVSPSYHTAIPSPSRIMLQNRRRCTWTRQTSFMYTRYKRRISLVNAFPTLRATLSLGKRVFALASEVCARPMRETFSLVTSFSPLRGMFSLGK